MSEQITVTLHSVEEDGLPDMDALVGRVAFIFDGCVVSGWPIQGSRMLRDRYGYSGQMWEANSDVGPGRPFGSVTHWLEFPVAVWNLGRAEVSA